jgi:hypothetical protein
VPSASYRPLSKTKLSTEDIAFLKTKLLESGVAMDGSIKTRFENGKLYLGDKGAPISVGKDNLNIDGKVVRYDQNKSFSDNYAAIKFQMNAHYGYHGFRLFSEANASSKSDAANDYAGGAALMAAIAFFLDAPIWVVAGAAVIAGLFAAVGVAYADELTASYKDFKCNENGYSIFLKDDTEIKTSIDASGKVTAERMSKDGHSQVIPDDRMTKITYVAPLGKKACISGSAALASFKETLAKTFGNGSVDGTVNGHSVE